MYHAIIINKQFKNEDFPLKFTSFSKKVEGSWEIYGVELDDSDLENFISEIQLNMKDDGTWYAHLYNNEVMIVIFKKKIFRVTPH